MDNNLLILFKDFSTSLKLRKLLNLFDYDNVEIVSSDNIDFDGELIHSRNFIIAGASAFEEQKLVQSIEKAIHLEIPVVFLTSNAEYYLRDMSVEKILNIMLPGNRADHKYVVNEITRRTKKNGTDVPETAHCHESDEKNNNSELLLKELRCLYYISDVMKIPDLKIDSVMKYICQSIENAVCYEGKGQARITYYGRVIQSDDFHETVLRICSPILLDDKAVGEIEVFLNQDHYKNTENILKMENDLINAIAEQIGKYLSSRKSIDELTKTNEELRRLASYHENVRENERKNVARAIHDEFGQKLLTLRYEILNLKSTLSDKDVDADSEIDELMGVLDGAMTTLRNITSSLRPGVLDKLGIAAAIEWLARDTEKNTGVKFHVNCSPEDMVLDDEYTTALFRIFQEATTNIIRHSGADEVLVNFKRTKDEVFLIVLDNGRGITEEDVNRDNSFGIQGMRERILSFQGNFSIMNNHDSGTVLKVSLPLQRKK